LQILLVDPSRARIVLSAKRTLVESKHPIIAKQEDAKVGLLTHAVVSKVFEKHLQVEFYNGTKGVVLHREARWAILEF
jgi:rRNA biogenesis protein RRP5